MTKKHEPRDPNDPKTRLYVLGLFGLVSRWPEVAEQPWIGQLLDIEEAERHGLRSMRGAALLELLSATARDLSL